MYLQPYMLEYEAKIGGIMQPISTTVFNDNSDTLREAKRYYYRSRTFSNLSDDEKLINIQIYGMDRALYEELKQLNSFKRLFLLLKDEEKILGKV